MMTPELIKETFAEVEGGFSAAAKNVDDLLCEISLLKDEINLLHDANMELRRKVLEFKNWTNERVSVLKKTVSVPEPDFRDNQKSRY